MDDEASSNPESDLTQPMPTGFDRGDTEPIPIAPVGTAVPPPPPVASGRIDGGPSSWAPPPTRQTELIGDTGVTAAPVGLPVKPVAPDGWKPGSPPLAPPTVAPSQPSTPPPRGGVSATDWLDSAGSEPESASSFKPKAPPNPPRGSAVPSASKSSQPGKWGWRALLAFVVGGLLTTGAFTAGRFSAPTEDASSPPSSVLIGTEDNQQDASPAIIEEEPFSGVEPAAFVAQRLGPAVVQVETDIGLGSGVVYRPGYVMTNNHVIEDAQAVRVKSSDGRTLTATIVGTDPATDIAVLAVTDGETLPVANLASSNDVQVGQLAVAIGSPFQLQQTVTAGIVSAVNRPVPSRVDRVVVAMIQTDAPINPGNSGGALANRAAEVIGINTSIQTGGFSNTNAGVGFAVPIDTASRVADLLVAGNPIEPGFLGVGGGQTPSDQTGVEITSVNSPSAAEDAGLEVGDRVLSIDGAPVTSLEELAGLVLARQAGDDVVLQIVRDGQTLELTAELGLRE